MIVLILFACGVILGLFYDVLSLIRLLAGGGFFVQAFLDSVLIVIYLFILIYVIYITSALSLKGINIIVIGMGIIVYKLGPNRHIDGLKAAANKINIKIKKTRIYKYLSR